MKFFFATVLFPVFSLVSFYVSAQTSSVANPSAAGETKHLFIDVHRVGPGKVTYEAAAGAHAKDLAVQGKYGVQFMKYWVDEKKGLIYCLSSASDTNAIRKTHAEAHGLLPGICYPVTGGIEAAAEGKKNLFLDVHYLGAGNVNAKDVAGAHEKDLAVQHKHGVNFINYWVNENEGVVMCLAEAKDSTSIIQTHKEAHGLVPAKVMKVKQGE
jgi:hypothetical protein